jgi:hypothetical protein
MDGLLYYQGLFYILGGLYRLQVLQSCLLQDILASTKPWNLYCAISGSHKCEKLLKVMLQHITYVPIPRFLIIVRTSYYVHCQFRRNPGPQYL